MYIYQSKIGKKHQTVVPFQIRERAGIAEGDSLLWEVKDDGTILVRPQKSQTEFLAEINKKVWGSYEQAKKQLEKERQQWEK